MKDAQRKIKMQPKLWFLKLKSGNRIRNINVKLYTEIITFYFFNFNYLLSQFKKKQFLSESSICHENFLQKFGYRIHFVKIIWILKYEWLIFLKISLSTLSQYLRKLGKQSHLKKIIVKQKQIICYFGQCSLL